VATTKEWNSRISAVTYQESLSLKEREKQVRELCKEAASDLGLLAFGRGYLETLGMRRMITEKGYDLPEGAVLMNDAPVAPTEPAE
jgi:hypothetical protein